jgi:release factor glutamine methyltransferase
LTRVPETLRTALAALTARLDQAGVPTPEIDAQLLVAHVLGTSRTALKLDTLRPLDEASRWRIEALGARRARREPLQHLIGSVGFRHLDVLVRPGVFIPRPETELLAEHALVATPDGGLVVEPCTGTGAVACSVATEARPARVIATDVSADAVALARENALRTGAGQVEVARGDLLDPLPETLRGAVDVLVSNPPYLADAELDEVEPEVRDWDPHAALVSGPTGHEVSDRLIELAGEWLAPGGVLLLEVADTRARECAARCEAAGLVEEAVLPDLAGRDRIVRARRPA